MREKGQNDTVDDDDIKDEEYIYSLDGSEDETLLEEQGHDVSVDNNNIVLFIYLVFFLWLISPLWVFLKPKHISNCRRLLAVSGVFK